MQRWLAVVVLSGCVRAQLVPCGELDCPVGSVCLEGAGRCVSDDQLAACAGATTGAECVSAGVAGRCIDGACTPISCGNGKVEGGEVCDDGNQSSGDGCSGTCSSEESCGNGIVDVARGEGCDCGTAAAPSSLCARPNSDSPDAECDLTCTPRFCGDGIVNTIEQCDGSAPTTLGCPSFGYYTGTLGCTPVCRVDLTTCSGRCGDGIVDPTHFEYCDTAPPVVDACLGLGQDLGPPRCNLACGADLSGCHKFGWLSAGIGPQERTGELWGGHGWVGFVSEPGHASVLADNKVATADHTYKAISGTATAIWAAGAAYVASWTPAGGWVETAAPWPATSVVVDVWASDSLGVYVSLEGSAALWKLSGTTWSSVTGPWPAAPRFGTTESTLYVIWPGPNVVAWSGTQATPLVLPPEVSADIRAVVGDPANSLWIDAGAQGVWKRAQATWTLEPNAISYSVSESTIAAHGDGIAIGQHGFQGGTSNQQALLRVNGRRPVATSWLGWPLIDDGAGNLYAGGATGLSVFYAQFELLMQTPFSPRAWHIPGGRVAVVIGGGLAVLQDDGSLIYNVASCSVGAVSASERVYCYQGTDLKDGATVVPVGSATGFWAAADDSAAMTVGDHTYSRRATPTGAWTTTASTIAFTDLAGLASTALFAIGHDDADPAGQSRIWRFDGTSWQSITPPLPLLQQLVVTDKHVFALEGGGFLYTYDRATQVATTSALPLYGLLSGGATDDRLYATQGGTLVHFDGTSWGAVRAPVSGINFLESFGDQVIIAANASMPPFIAQHRLEVLHRY